MKNAVSRAAVYLQKKENERVRAAAEILGGLGFALCVIAVMMLWLCLLGEIH